MNAKKKVTFADIAAYTGFSKTTISRYFNDPDSLILENRQKIAGALTALDYKFFNDAPITDIYTS